MTTRPGTRTTASAGARTPRRELLFAWLNLAVLWAFAVAQPLFELLSDNPNFFVARGNTTGDILILAFGLTLVPPTLMVLVELALFRLPEVRLVVHLAFVGVLVAALALQVLDDLTGSGSAALIPVALALGALAALAYLRAPAARGILTALSPAPLVFLLLFLVFSPVSDLIFDVDQDQEARAGVRSEAPVVFLVFDELSPTALMDDRRRINAARYPHIAALAGDATWYRNTTTVADQTTRAVPALLSGLLPEQGALATSAGYPRNLFTLLGRRYSLNVTETVTQLCPENLCEQEPAPASERLELLASDLSVVSLHLILPDDLADDLPPVNQTFGDFRAEPANNDDAAPVAHSIPPEERGRAFERFIRSIGPATGRPPLHFIHVLLPHIPWLYLPTGQQYPNNGLRAPGLNQQVELWGEDGWGDDRSLAEQGLQRYLLQVGYVDRLVGRLIARLRARGIYDRSLIVLASDHGISYKPGEPRRAVTAGNVENVAPSMLIVKAPAQRRARIVDAPARTVDVLPTVADLLDIELSWDLQGTSLADPDRRPPGTVSVSPAEGSPVRLPFAEFRRRWDFRVHELVGAFGSGGLGGIYRFGPAPELVGRRLGDLPVQGQADARVELEAPGQFQAVDTRAAVVPAFVTGRMTGVGADRPLAVALNGRVAAVTSSFELNGETRFAAMVPPSALRHGRNKVEVLAVRGGPGGPRTLVHLGRQTAALARRDEETVITGASSREARVVPGAVEGYVEELETESGALVVRGWSAASAGAADRVLVFLGGRLVAEGRPSVDRGDIAARFGPDALKAGFRFTAALGAGAPAAQEARIRVFGVVGERASELERILPAG